MNLRIDSPGKNSAFVDNLPHFYLFTWISALWNKDVKFRICEFRLSGINMFAALVAGGRTEINA